MDNPSVDNVFVSSQETVSGSGSRRMIIIIVILLLTISFLTFLVWKLGQKPVLKVFPSKNNALKQEAKLNVTSFMNINLQSQYSPSQLPSSVGGIQPTIDANGNVIDPNRFFIYWKLKDMSILSTVKFVDDKNLDNRRVSFTIPKVSQTPSASTAMALISPYISTQPLAPWNCREVNNINNQKNTLCESFWTNQEGNTKTGIGILNSINSSDSSIFICQIYKGSEFFDDSSCTIYK